MLSVVVLPSHTLGYSAKAPQGVRRAEPYGPVQNIEMQLSARLQLQLLPNLLGNDNLVFRRDLDDVHRIALIDRVSIAFSNVT
jgi:hypothetical protein